MPTLSKDVCYAVYDIDAIYGIGETISAALRDCGDAGPLVPMHPDNNYPDGVIVDFTHAHLVSSDTEVASGQRKVRRCSQRLYDAVLQGDGQQNFEIRPDGVLDTVDS